MQTKKRAKILSASAGSGKTYQLAYKYVRDVIDHPEMYRAILAVTFTNKATEEMKSRILREIHILASGGKSDYLTSLIEEFPQYDEHTIRMRAKEARTNILHDYSHFSILTIDRFFQRIIRAFIKELDLELNYNLELDTDLLIKRASDALVDRISEEDELRRWMLKFAEDRLASGNRWDMRHDMKRLGKELFKRQANGHVDLSQSKEELDAIISRIGKRVDNVLEQMQYLGDKAVKIIDDKNLDIKSFNRGFVSILREYADGIFKTPSTSLRNAAECVEAWFTKDKFKKVDHLYITTAEELRPVAEEICKLYDNNLKLVKTYTLLKKQYHSFALLADLYNQIGRLCEKENLMILDETKNILSTFVNENNAPFIYEKVGNRYERYMIDEFQDTSIKEWKNMLPLLQNAMSSSADTSVLIVGDIKQSIYRWRGGDWRLLGNVARRDLGENDTENRHLEHNYRSLSNVVEFNNRLIDKVVKLDNEYLNNMLEGAMERGDISEELKISLHDITQNAYSSHSQKPGRKTSNGNNGYVEVDIIDGNISADKLISTIEDAVARGYHYNDILILVRSHGVGQIVADTLFAYKQEAFTSKGLPGFNVMTNDVLTIDSSELTQFIIATLRLAVNIKDDIQRAIFNRFLDRSFESQLDDNERDFLIHIAQLSPMEAFEAIVARYKLHERKHCIAYLQAIHEQIVNFTTSRLADIHQYLVWWDEKGHKDELKVDMGDNTIEILTIHKAKGLERPVVIIPYCNWQTKSATGRNVLWCRTEENTPHTDTDLCLLANIPEYPVTYGNDMTESVFASHYHREVVMDHVDAINLLYVAITRAAEELYIFVTDLPKDLSEHNKIGTLISKSVDSVCGDAEPYVNVFGDSCRKYTYGEKVSNVTHENKKEGSTQFIIDDYVSNIPEIKIHYPTKRYRDEGVYIGNSPRNQGIRLHKLLESAITEQDLNIVLQNMEADCVIDKQEANKLRSIINNSLHDHRIKEWFNYPWQDVKREANIISKDGVKRPDRVMFDGGRVVVVDYKFGQVEDKSYTRQVESFMRLLKQMGRYNSIKGYIWYVSLGKVVEV